MLFFKQKESDSLLRVELDACKQELELERSRSQVLLHRCKDKGKGECISSQVFFTLQQSMATVRYLTRLPTIFIHCKTICLVLNLNTGA